MPTVRVDEYLPDDRNPNVRSFRLVGISGTDGMQEWLRMLPIPAIGQPEPEGHLKGWRLSKVVIRPESRDVANAFATYEPPVK